MRCQLNNKLNNLKNYDECLDWIYSRGSTKGKHSLENIRRLLDVFDNPQDKIKVIHVAGTNGKGSTSQYLASVLSETVKCGLFISPYMESILESISINGKQISEENFIAYINKLIPIVENLDTEGYHNTYFEVLTAIMYMYFSDNNIDISVVEVGLGGSLDSTNIIKKPIASVISTISYDHINVLGNTIEEIAENKAGIIKDGSPVFVYPQEYSGAMNSIEEKSTLEKSKIYTFSKEEITDVTLNSEFNQFSFRNFKDIKTKLIGVHQLYNASLALMVLNYFKDEFNLTDDIIKKGILKTQNHGRLELIHKNPNVIVDGSHNDEAIDALIESLKTYDYDRLIVGFSILKDKDFEYIISKLATVADKIIITNIDNPRAFKLEDLKTEVEKKFNDVTSIENRIEAYEYSKSITKNNDLVLWCGSLYLIREFIVYEKNNNSV